MITPTTLPCEVGCLSLWLVVLYFTRLSWCDDFLPRCIICTRIFDWGWRFSMNLFAFLLRFPWARIMNINQ